MKVELWIRMGLLCATGCSLVKNPLLEESEGTTAGSGSGSTTATSNPTSLDDEEGTESTTASTTSGADTTSTTSGQDSTTTDSTTEPVTDSSTTAPVPVCGNDVLEQAEACDGTDFGGTSCESLGYDSGPLGCTADCMLDALECVLDGMVVVPGGVFEMGSNVEADEQPIRQVEVDTFYIDLTEVRTMDYALCVDAGACTEPGSFAGCNWMVAGRETHPINCVQWSQAESYCAWADGGAKRLPTEAEWEKAARGTDARAYPWGDAPPPDCMHAVMYEMALGMQGCGLGTTNPVGTLPMGASPYGALDMAGNVWEWVADWYAPLYDAAETTNPTGPAMGTERLVRGGAWLYTAEELGGFRTPYRLELVPDTGNFDLGFRCAQSPPTMP